MNTKQAIKRMSDKQFAVEQKKDAGPFCWQECGKEQKQYD